MIILRQHFSDRGIRIQPSPSQAGHEQVCLDLSVGGVFTEPGSGPRALSRHHKLRPGACVVFRTNERFQLPDDVFGLITSKGSLTTRGLVVANTKVDPCFAGQLDIAVYNASRYPLTISPNQHFCSIVFLELDGHVSDDSTRIAPPIMAPRAGLLTAIWTRHDSTIVAGLITIILSGVAAAVATYVTAIALK